MGVVVATVAVGAAFSFGAFAFSMLWWPLAALMGFMAFSFLLPFGAFATFGLGLFFPKLLSMVSDDTHTHTHSHTHSIYCAQSRPNLVCLHMPTVRARTAAHCARHTMRCACMLSHAWLGCM